MVMMGSYWTETQGVGRADLYRTPVCDQDSRIKLFHNFEKKRLDDCNDIKGLGAQ